MPTHGTYPISVKELMRALCTAIAVVVGTSLGTAALPAPSSATAEASGPTCHGKKATIVGSPNADIDGTPRADVIVSAGARSVEGGDGDDTICMTGEQPTLPRRVVAGPGDDYFRSVSAHFTNAALGPGSDLYVGSSAPDEVRAVENDGQRDRISTGEGRDTVFLSKKSGADVVRTGGGQDSVTARENPRLSLDGGASNDTLIIRGIRRSHAQGEASRLVVNNRQRRALRDGATVLTWQSFNRFAFFDDSYEQRFIGSTVNESVSFGPFTDLVSADMQAGSDLISVFAGNRTKRLLNGGPGQDTIDTFTTIAYGEGDPDYATSVDVDLVTQTMKLSRGTENPVLRLHSIDNVNGNATTLRVRGNDDANVIDVWACSAEVRAGDGADVVRSTIGGSTDFECGSAKYAFYGESGDDHLLGTFYDDVLIGGDGNDTADGGGHGVDTCDAETVSRCQGAL